MLQVTHLAPGKGQALHLCNHCYKVSNGLMSWSGIASSGSGGGAICERNAGEKNEMDDSTTRSISNSFVVKTGSIDDASELVSNTASP